MDGYKLLILLADRFPKACFQRLFQGMSTLIIMKKEGTSVCGS